MKVGKMWMTHKALLSLLCGLALVMLSVAGYLFILASQPKQVTLLVDGRLQSYETKADTVGSFLAEQNITVQAEDVLTPPADTPITDAMTINLQTSWEVPVLVDGQKKVVHTVHRDVAGVLKDGNIPVRERDRVDPPLTAAVTKETLITVTRVDEKVVTVEQVVPYQEIRRNDNSLTKGQVKVLQQGTEGKAVLHYKVKLENGKEVGRTLIKEEVLKPKRDRIVAVGTGNNTVTAAAIVSRGGKQFRAQRVLRGVTLTAYSPEGGGKSPGSTGYGRTATGVKAVEGRTIAVDPNVIPLGWWVYIDGVGYRRAEDVGGAIVGNKIDVFFNSNSVAQQFGRKRGKTVYIIGPEKP